MPAESEQITRDVLAQCRDLGFALAGVADASPGRWAREFKAWLAAGKQGSMAYLERNAEERLDPGRVLPGARSVVMVADRYATRGEAPQSRADELPASPRGRIARYARGTDYHVVIKKRLHALCDALRVRFPGAAFRAFVDTAPVLERELAARAGLGWIGKHTLLIHPKQGSWMLLGGVLTTLELEPPVEQEVVADHCGTCTRCIDACPTDAITPYSVDASRCVSYLTIERRGPIDPALHEGIGDWLFGCDVCQEVCPHNGGKAAKQPATAGELRGKAAHEEELTRVRDEYRAERDSFDLLEVLGWTAADRSRELSGSSMKRATLDMFRRNALIVLGNELRRRPDPALASRVRRVSEDESEPELVRRTAREVAARIPTRPE